jgi:ribosomal subunit interface protein
MEIVVTGRHVEVKERFRRHLTDKLAKVPQLAPQLQRLDVVISHETNRRQAESCDRVEITGVGKGPVVRAEAAAEDLYVALDRAYTKLLERLRRAHDRKVLRRGRAESLSQIAARNAAREPEPVPDSHTVRGLVAVDGGLAVTESAVESDFGIDDSPIQIRQKVHAAQPMTMEQALYEMELVGHDFYLFCDSATSRPSAVYRRRGWEYGVLHLDVDTSAANTLIEQVMPRSERSWQVQPASAG